MVYTSYSVETSSGLAMIFGFAIIVGGLGMATVFTLYLTPVAYALLAGLSKPELANEKQLVDEMTHAKSLTT